MSDGHRAMCSEALADVSTSRVTNLVWLKNIDRYPITIVESREGTGRNIDQFFGPPGTCQS